MTDGETFLNPARLGIFGAAFAERWGVYPLRLARVLPGYLAFCNPSSESRRISQERSRFVGHV